MPALIRKTDTAEFVSRKDTAANQDGRPAPHADWLLVEGQPKEAQRVRVRAPVATDIVGGMSYADVVKLGLVAIDGEPATVEDLNPLWTAEIGKLVLAVIYSPLVGPLSDSTAPRASESSDSSTSPPSS
jgi:hypothetical protein